MKYVIQKKSLSHRKKIKKMGKDVSTFRKTKKDPGIPNLWPFKEQLMRKIQETKEERELKKQNKNRNIVETSLNKQTSEEYIDDSMQVDAKTYSNPNKIQSGNYFRELRKVIEESDVILQVLDARDPMGCRSRDFEEKVGASGKRLVLVLNKIDLVPSHLIQQWLDVLRKEFPTVAFKASTQQQKKNMGVLGKSFSFKATTNSQLLSLTECVGAGELMQLLKNYARSHDTKTAITVGVIGYPNVGKSSLINSLKRGKATGVGATPGFTKTVQEVHIDSKIKLLDSPGVLLDVAGNGESVLALRNAVSLSKLEDPISVVEQLLSKVPIESLVPLYHIRRVSTCHDFLIEVAAKKGKLKKGGIADLESTALAVLQDWNEGTIPFYTLPPQQDNFKSEVTIAHDDGSEYIQSDQVSVLPAEGTETLTQFAVDLQSEEYDFNEHFDA